MTADRIASADHERPPTAAMSTADAGAINDPRDQLELIVLHLDFEHYGVDFDELAVDDRPADEHGVGGE
jgi:hypothetical protein